MLEELYAQIINTINKRRKPEKPFIIGINGVDASGKTTFSKKLEIILKQNNFKTQLIHLDDFHNPLKIRYKDDNPVNSYIKNAFDFKKLESELLKPLKLSNNLIKKIKVLDLETDEFSKTKEYNIYENTIILLEGVLLFREPIHKYIDLKIFLDITFDEVIKRVSKRDKKIMGDKVEEKYNKKYIPIQKWYFENYNPKKQSDIVINNENYSEPKITKYL